MLACEHVYLYEELLQQGGRPAVVQVPVLGGVADVRRVQQEGQGLGLVHAGGHRSQLRQADTKTLVFFSANACDQPPQ